MKLLEPRVTKNIQGEELSLDILRLQETRKLIQDLNIQKAKAEVEFQKTLSDNLKKWEAFEEEHSSRLRQMERELQDAEEKKLNQLIPFGILREGTDDRFKEANKFLASLRDREERADDVIETFEDKLDELGEREQSLKRSEEIHRVMQDGLEIQRESILEQSEKFTQRMFDFAEKERQDIEIINKRKAELALLEETRELQEDAWNKKEKELTQWSVRLHEERGLLQSAWDELERKSKNLNIPITQSEI